MRASSVVIDGEIVALAAEVSFAEWTRDGSLRHAAFVALRDEKRAKDVVRELRGA